MHIQQRGSIRGDKSGGWLERSHPHKLIFCRSRLVFCLLLAAVFTSLTPVYHLLAAVVYFHLLYIIFCLLCLMCWLPSPTLGLVLPSVAHLLPASLHVHTARCRSRSAAALALWPRPHLCMAEAAGTAAGASAHGGKAPARSASAFASVLVRAIALALAVAFSLALTVCSAGSALVWVFAFGFGARCKRLRQTVDRKNFASESVRHVWQFHLPRPPAPPIPAPPNLNAAA